MRADIPNTFKVTNTRLAACLSALGFPYGVDVTISERKGGEAYTQFMFGPISHRFPQLNGVEVVAKWMSGELRKKQPTHVLCVMMLAQENYDALMAMQKGLHHRLNSTAKGELTVYREGQEAHSITQSKSTELTDDACLVAALGGIGLPVVSWTQPEAGRRVYRVARTGYPVKLATGELHLHDARDVMLRDPTKEDPLRLRLEVTQPLHPLCLMYDALHHRTELKKRLGKSMPLLMIDEGGGRVHEKSGTTFLVARQALVSINASGRVMDHATAHMKAPPINWNA